MKVNIEFNLETKDWGDEVFFHNKILENKKLSELVCEPKLENLLNFLSNLTLNHLIKAKNSPDFLISFLFSGNEKIQELNRDFRNKDYPTNVLSLELISEELQDKLQDSSYSFELSEYDDNQEDFEPDDFLIIDDSLVVFLGEIAMSFEKTRDESIELGISFIDHFCHLIIHSILHLLGFDHEDCEEGARQMEEVEIKILEKIGINNPYS